MVPTTTLKSDLGETISILFQSMWKYFKDIFLIPITPKKILQQQWCEF